MSEDGFGQRSYDECLLRAQLRDMVSVKLESVQPIFLTWLHDGDPHLELLALSGLSGCTVPELLDARISFLPFQHTSARIGTVSNGFRIDIGRLERRIGLQGLLFRQQGRLYVPGQRLDIDSGTRVIDMDYTCIKPTWILTSAEFVSRVRRLRDSLVKLTEVDTTFDRCFRLSFPGVVQHYHGRTWPLYRFFLVSLYVCTMTFYLSRQRGPQDRNESGVDHLLPTGQTNIMSEYIVRSVLYGQPLEIAQNTPIALL
jgi:hypothetical protein